MLYNRVTMLVGGMLIAFMHGTIAILMSVEFHSYIAVLLVGIFSVFCFSCSCSPLMFSLQIFFVNVPFWMKFCYDHFRGQAIDPKRQSSVFIRKRTRKGKSRCLSWIDFKYMWSLILISWLVGENFPFSHFPMYSSQKNYVSSVFLTNST